VLSLLAVGLDRAMFHRMEAFYNRTRRHSTLDYLSPVDFEATTVASSHTQPVRDPGVTPHVPPNAGCWVASPLPDNGASAQVVLVAQTTAVSPGQS
jgi:hypothetical protein